VTRDPQAGWLLPSSRGRLRAGRPAGRVRAGTTHRRASGTAPPCAAPKPDQLSPCPLWPFGCAGAGAGRRRSHVRIFGVPSRRLTHVTWAPYFSACLRIKLSRAPRHVRPGISCRVNHACCRDRPGGRTVDVKRPSTGRAESGSGAFPSPRAHLTTPLRGASSLDGLLSADPVISHAAAGPMQN
jgi:hypothetical protein